MTRAAREGAAMSAIDLFAGLGGLTEGARAAGISVVWAADHCPVAVETHAANHPEAAHLCQDLHQADWSEVPAHDVMLAAPCCQGHSHARGKSRPEHDASRSTAWAVVSAAEFHRPPFVVVENVPAFRSWQIYPAWLLAMQSLGYSVAPHVLDAADYGVAQNRVRLLLVCAKSRAPLNLNIPRQSHVGASSFLDFAAGKWAPIVREGRSPKTLARIEDGRREHGDRFVTSYYGQTRGGRSIERPIGTITTRDRWAVIDGDRMRMLSVSEAKAAMSFRADYLLPANGRTAMHLQADDIHVAGYHEIAKRQIAAAKEGERMRKYLHHASGCVFEGLAPSPLPCGLYALLAEAGVGSDKKPTTDEGGK